MSLELVISFASGVGVALFGALFSVFFQRRADRRRDIENRTFEIYMKLMEIHGLYFWMASSELRKEQAKPDVCSKIWHLTWQATDLLRSADRLPELPEILDLLFSTREMTASLRYQALGALVQRMAKRVNPRYADVVKRISDENLTRVGGAGSPNAPGWLSQG